MACGRGCALNRGSSCKGSLAGGRSSSSLTSQISCRSFANPSSCNHSPWVTDSDTNL